MSVLVPVFDAQAKDLKKILKNENSSFGIYQGQ